MTCCCVLGCSEMGCHIFPKDSVMKKRWLKAIRRINLIPTKTTKICRKHFLESDYLTISIHTGLHHQRRTLKKSAVPSLFPWNVKSGKVKFREKRLQTGDNRKSSSNKPPSLQILNGTRQESSGNIVNIDISYDKESCVSQNTFVTSEIKNITIATQTPNNFRSLSTEVLLSDDESIDFFTGLESYPKFTIVMSTLLPMAYNIEHTQDIEIGLSVKDLFLMLLIKLRRNKHDFEIGKMFGVSETEAANIIVTWINFVSEIWQLFEIWPSQELVNVYMPDVFQKNHPSTRVVIDETNCGINIANFFKGKCQVPGLLMKQDQKLAIKRVDKERLMEFRKTYEILSSELNEHYLPLASKIFCICVMLCYFKKATINKNL